MPEKKGAGKMSNKKSPAGVDAPYEGTSKNIQPNYSISGKNKAIVEGEKINESID